MKLSVSVPDELWDSVRKVINADSPSAVVQEALRRAAASPGAAPTYAEAPVDDELTKSMAAVRERMLVEARQLYQDGYRQGVELAGRLSWRELDWFAPQGLVATAKLIAQQHIEIAMDRAPEGAKPLIDRHLLIKYAGGYADQTGSVGWRPDRLTIEGLDRALRDMWEQLRSPHRSSSAATDTGGAAAIAS
jgi:hypothetical protein